MEHLVRVQNERDRRTLAWLRVQVGDAAIAEAAQHCGGPSKPYLSSVCRMLGGTAPRFTAPPRLPAYPCFPERAAGADARGGASRAKIPPRAGAVTILYTWSGASARDRKTEQRRSWPEGSPSVFAPPRPGPRHAGRFFALGQL